MEIYKSKLEYYNALKKRALLPAGFRAATASLLFNPEEKNIDTPLKMNISLILLDEPTVVFGAVFTKNKFPGHPVIIGKKRLSEAQTMGVLINNRIANVCTPHGGEDAEDLLNHLAGHLNIEAKQLFPASTGVIGWRLPLREMKEGLPKLAGSLKKKSIFDVAKSIMTTDLYPKIREISIGGGKILGIAKGAGMIAPDMATMLVFLMTDIDIERDTFRGILKETADSTFNRISVDGDQSTSDMVIGFSSRRVSPVGEKEFADAVFRVCKSLAEDVVRNGEGVSHVVRVFVDGAQGLITANGLGKSIINSPLVATAISGNDPNVGRIIMAVGDYFGKCSTGFDPEKIEIFLGGELIFRKGIMLIDHKKEEVLHDYIKNASLDTKNKYPEHEKCVEIRINLGMGDISTELIGSDLSCQYVRENSEYRS